jgi:iron complex transport system substrate-binding protein
MAIEIDAITEQIVDAAVKLHKRLGPGLLESVYEPILGQLLEQRGLKVDRQHTVPFQVDGLQFERGLCVDLLVEERVVVELKSIEKLAPVHTKQVLTYLRLLDLPVGLPDQLRRRDLEGGSSSDREQPSPHCPITPPRKPGGESVVD